MTSTSAWAWAQVTGHLWFRVSLYGLAAVFAALLSVQAAPLVPDGVADMMREGAAFDLLMLLAPSMLVVATFSLGTLVQAFAAAASLATPRATQILIEDPFSQNVLSTFLGAFVFSIVGLVAQSAGYYSADGEVVLLAASALVIATVIGAFFAWLDHLANMVRLGKTIRKVADRAEAVLAERARAPNLGGAPLAAIAPDLPVATGGTIGYVRHIDVAALEAVAEAAGGRIAVRCMPGELADPFEPLACTDWPADEREAAAIRRAFRIGLERTFDQDPRFCLEVLTEIASRALWPGLNDPGTAINVIAVQQGLLTRWALELPDADPTPRCPRVVVTGLAPQDLFEDAFGPLLRDAARHVEVGLRLQKTLAAARPAYAACARDFARRALDHADRALPVAADRERLAKAAARVGTLPA